MMDKGLVFEKFETSTIKVFVDSDYTGDLDKRRLTTGYVFTLGSGPVSWRSTIQSWFHFF